ncbi:MAG: hypothetical protein RAO92_07610, partial [Candidatus Euphemobacter frigidus]|nr:hypothetical protein [Candidatus Euphemobacter frigidus]
MNEERIDGQSISWIPLKEASQLIGCSVKTIRRRIKSGSCRSMIEYHGQKAIRLVARDDVLKGTTFLKKLPYGTGDESLAARALEAVHLHLDDTIESSTSNLTRVIDTAASGSRTYLLAVLGITTILITALLLFFLEKRGNIIEQRMVDTRNDLSTIIVHGQELIGRETANAVK